MSAQAPAALVAVAAAKRRNGARFELWSRAAPRTLGAPSPARAFLMPADGKKSLMPFCDRLGRWAPRFMVAKSSPLLHLLARVTVEDLRACMQGTGEPRVCWQAGLGEAGAVSEQGRVWRPDQADGAPQGQAELKNKDWRRCLAMTLAPGWRRQQGVARARRKRRPKAALEAAN